MAKKNSKKKSTKGYPLTVRATVDRNKKGKIKTLHIWIWE